MLELFFGQYDSLIDFLDSGGWVTRWILLACAILVTVILERLWYLWRVYPRVRAEALSQWNAREETQSWAAQRIRDALISQLRVGLESGLPIIRVMVPMAPLLGLMGTVMGMLQVFDAVAFSGGNDTRAMAGGISHAMIATMSGLVVSVIGLFFSNLIGGRIRAESDRLPDLLGPAQEASGA
tara:strand:+ start:2254 stop:2799 length:546 start_codon:yes stop_codon:yes gene_type:complete